MNELELKQYIHVLMLKLEAALCESCVDELWNIITASNDAINTITANTPNSKKGQLDFGDKIVAYEIIYKEVDSDDGQSHLQH